MTQHRPSPETFDFEGLNPSIGAEVQPGWDNASVEQSSFNGETRHVVDLIMLANSSLPDVRYTDFSGPIMALKGLHGMANSQVSEIYRQRADLRKQIESKQEEYIASWKSGGLPSISDRCDAERAFFDQIPIVEFAVDLGMIAEVPEPVAFWELSQDSLDHLIDERCSSPIISTQPRGVAKVIGYLVNLGYQRGYEASQKQN